MSARSRTTTSATRIKLGSAGILVLLALGSFLASTLFDGGFLRGFFHGATAGLVAVGVFFLGYDLVQRRRHSHGDMWRPSDER